MRQFYCSAASSTRYSSVVFVHRLHCIAVCAHWLRCTAVCVHRLYCIAVCVHRLCCIAVCAQGLYCTAVCAHRLYCTAVCAHRLYCTAVCAHRLYCIAVCVHRLYCIAVCGHGLYCTAVCAHRLYCTAVCAHRLVPTSNVRPSLRRFSQNPQIHNNVMYRSLIPNSTQIGQYRGADKSLARPWRGNKLQRPRLTTLNQDLRRTNNSNIFMLFVRRKSWYSVVSLGRCSLFPSRVGLRTYQHPGVMWRAAVRIFDPNGPRRVQSPGGNLCVPVSSADCH